MELYRKLMNHGIIIYENALGEFILDKRPTVCDEAVCVGRFFNFDDALSECKRLINWVEETPVHVQDGSTVWKMEMAYRHKGLGQKYAELGEYPSASYDMAMAEANKRAEAYIIHADMEKSVDGFEVRVRPCRKRN